MRFSSNAKAALIVNGIGIGYNPFTMKRKEFSVMQKKLWNKDYILLLHGKTVSTIGDLMYSVAIGYWVYQQTGSSALMGIMSSISMFVTMFFSPIF